MTASSPKVLVLPGSQYQIPLIRKAQRRGFHVVCTDRNPDCPGGRIADEFHPVGLDDRAALLELARAIQPRGILTDQTDAGVPVVAWLSAQLGLRGIGETRAGLFTNKHLMREFSGQHGFPVPEFALVGNLQDALRAAADIGYPVVIKPVRSQASKGVHCIHTPAAMTAAFPGSERHAGGEGVLVEQFIDGTEFTVEGFAGAHGHTTLGISRKAHYARNPMVARSLRYTPDDPEFDYDELRSLNDAWINRSGLPFGITHAEYKFCGGRYYLIEVATRGGGTRIASDIVPWVSGIDYLELLLDAVLEGRTEGVTAVPERRCAQLEFFDFPAGRVRAIEGVQQAMAMAGVHDIVLGFSVGDDLPALADDTARPGYFILLTDTGAELEALRGRVLDTVTVRVD